MAAKRKKRGRRNRGRFGFLYKLLSFVLILAAIVLGCIVFFKVNTILVTGQSQYTQAQIVEVSGVKLGDNLYRFNKNQAAIQIRTELPYIDTVAFSRKLPDTLIVTVTECVPVGVIQEGENWWLLDAKLKLLDRGDATLAQGRGQVTGIVPLSPKVGDKLTVAEDQRQKLEHLSALLSALYDRGLSDKLGFIDVTAENAIRFGYEDRLTVVMPLFSEDFSALVYRFSQVLATMEENGQGQAGGTLNFSYDSDKAYLSPKRWMPGDDPVPTPTPAPEGAEAPSVTPTPAPAG